MLEQRVKGALVRARISSIKEMDAPTAYFFGLERKEAQKKCMLHLKRRNGTITSDPTEMRTMGVAFYKELFGNMDCDVGSMDQFLQDLPKLSSEDKNSSDVMISFDELSKAVKQLFLTGKSPGIDGLPAEFYKAFWGVLGEDLYNVFCECFKRGCLPNSCQRAVLSLLPKNGDLGLLKNWRPVSLMCLL